MLGWWSRPTGGSIITYSITHSLSPSENNQVYLTPSLFPSSTVSIIHCFHRPLFPSSLCCYRLSTARTKASMDRQNASCLGFLYVKHLNKQTNKQTNRNKRRSKRRRKCVCMVTIFWFCLFVCLLFGWSFVVVCSFVRVFVMFPFPVAVTYYFVFSFQCWQPVSVQMSFNVQITEPRS